MPYQNETKQKCLLLAAHIYEAPCSQSGLYHPQGLGLADMAWARRGSWNALELHI